MGVALFLTIDGVLGATVAAGHPGSIEVTSWSWGIANSGRGGSGRGAPSVRELILQMPTTAALPQLLGRCATGATAPTAVLTAQSPGADPHTWLRVTMTDVTVTRVATSGSAAEQRSDDEVALSFATVVVEHIGQEPDGSAGPTSGFSWNVRKHRPLNSGKDGKAKGAKAVRPKGSARFLE